MSSINHSSSEALNTSIVSPADDWVCAKCTLINESKENLCCACGSSKASSIDETLLQNLSISRDAETWICPRCTLQNDDSSVRCSLCGSMVSGAQEVGQGSAFFRSKHRA